MSIARAISAAREFFFNCQRVLLITHKPAGVEYGHIAKATAIGIAAIGGIGFLVTMLAYAIAMLRG